MIRARDVASPSITVEASWPVKEVARLLLARGIGAVPVVDPQGKLVGMISQGDLMRGAAPGTERERPRWLLALAGDDTLAYEYPQARERPAADVMTRKVITASPDTPLRDICGLMDKNAIERVPILEGERLVGIVSRADVIHVIATASEQLILGQLAEAVRRLIPAKLPRQRPVSLPPAHEPTTPRGTRKSIAARRKPRAGT